MQDSGGAFGKVIRAGHSSRAFGKDSRTSIQSWHELRKIHRSFIRRSGNQIMLSIHQTVVIMPSIMQPSKHRTIQKLLAFVRNSCVVHRSIRPWLECVLRGNRRRVLYTFSPCELSGDLKQNTQLTTGLTVDSVRVHGSKIVPESPRPFNAWQARARRR